MNEEERAGNSEAVIKKNYTGILVIGWICALLSLFIYPFIFGVLGVIAGILSTKGGSKAGLSLIVTSIILMGIGLIFSGVIMNYTRRFLGI